MIITGSNLTITWKLKATDNFPVAALTDLDVVIKNPDGTVTYTEDFTEDSSALPTLTEDGSYVITVTPASAGVYEYSLTHGTSLSYSIIDSIVVSVVDGTTTVSSTVFTASA